MEAIRVEPKKADSALLEEVGEPDEREGSVLLEGIAAASRKEDWFRSDVSACRMKSRRRRSKKGYIHHGQFQAGVQQ